ncbi:hypothetical protein [Deinococcus yavapaiensis]|uniref:Uncharacterized protein n=1 Tax=Deinococcus yavapaiensis KR-236 TaxID=694435 RepID=A0A318S2X3_9DEIO|nr:hypothetical protein [Deinococcus yavapaiensis]PYE50437.1 hypothetical protein DES52_11854 [Deinococcus yavapaiensis KR-236]
MKPLREVIGVRVFDAHAQDGNEARRDVRPVSAEIGDLLADLEARRSALLELGLKPAQLRELM